MRSIFTDYQLVGMRLEKLQLVNFKNYEEISLEFPAQINCFLGLNGSGKTNLLDAIFYLGFTKSFIQSNDSLNIKVGCNSGMIKGSFQKDKPVEVSCHLQAGSKKLVRENGIDYTKLSDHIGKYPVVIISPADVDLVNDGSETRRKFFDSMISQIDHEYLEALMQYQYVLKQRNSLLKLFHDRNYSDPDLIETYNQQLSASGRAIFEKRDSFIKEFIPVFNQSYQFLVGRAEEANLQYKSEVGEFDYEVTLKKNLSRDMLLQRTTFGIHRDDYDFLFTHGELKKFGSQGQQKSFLVALKLAYLELVKNHTGVHPILLLDDIFDKLDDTRIAQLIQSAASGSGQLFITDAAPERTRNFLKKLGVNFDSFEVANGTVKKI